MKKASVVCCILALILVGLSCTSGTTLGISVTEVNNGVMIKNVGNVDCLVSVSSPEGDQQFGLSVSESITVTDMAEPIEVSVVSR